MVPVLTRPQNKNQEGGGSPLPREPWVPFRRVQGRGQLPRKDACLSLPIPAAPGWPFPSSPAWQDGGGGWWAGSGLDNKRLLRSRDESRAPYESSPALPCSNYGEPLLGESSHLTLPGEDQASGPQGENPSGNSLGMKAPLVQGRL